MRIYNRSLSITEINALYNAKNTSLSDTETLGAGYYYYEAFVPPTQNYTLSSLLLPLNVTKASSVVSITLTNNDTTYGTTQTAWCNITSGDQTATLALYRNSTEVSSGSGNQSE